MSISCVGVDLGTTNMGIAHRAAGCAGTTVVRGPSGQETTDTALAFTPSGLLFGAAAMAAAGKNVELITSSKRIIGASPTQKDVLEAARLLLYDVAVQDDRFVFEVCVGGQKMLIDAVVCAALMLKEAMQRIESQCGVDVAKSRVCITVPAYFDSTRKQATVDAAVIAGFQTPDIVNEPTAALLYYQALRPEQGAYMVLDVGGGTTDVSVCTVRDGITSVKVTDGNMALGGDDYSAAAFEHAKKKMLKDGHQVDARCAAALMRAVTTAVHTLTTETSAQVVIPITLEETFSMCITRTKFDELTQHLTAGVLEVARSALKKVPDLEDVKVLMVGGACRMLTIQAAVKSELGLEVLPMLPEMHTAVAHGACIFACMQADHPDFRSTMVDQCAAHSLGLVCHRKCLDEEGVEHDEDYIEWMIKAGCPLTAMKTQKFTTSTPDQRNLCFQLVEGEDAEIPLGAVDIEVTPTEDGVCPKFIFTIEATDDGLVALNVKEVTGGGSKQATFSTSHCSGGDHTSYLMQARQQFNRISEWAKEMEECQELAMKIEDMIDGLDEEEQQDAQERLDGIRTRAFELKVFMQELQAKVDRSDTESYHSHQDEDDSRKRQGGDMSADGSKVQKVAE